MEVRIEDTGSGNRWTATPKMREKRRRNTNEFPFRNRNYGCPNIDKSDGLDRKRRFRDEFADNAIVMIIGRLRRGSRFTRFGRLCRSMMVMTAEARGASICRWLVT